MKAWLCLLVLFCLVAPVAAQQPASVVSVFHIRDGKVTLVSTEIVYGKSPNYFAGNGDFLITASASGGTRQKEAWIDDPRVNRILNFTEEEPSAVVRDDVDFSVTLPYRDDTSRVSVYDKDKKLLVETDLTGAKAAFCAAHSADERCRNSVPYLAIGVVIVAAIIGAVAFLVLKRKKAGGR